MSDADQNQIDQIMDNFDFEEAYELFKAMNWTWHSGGHVRVPEPPELKKKAREYLRHLASNKELSFTGSGRIMAMRSGEFLSLFMGVDYIPELEDQ